MEYIVGRETHFFKVLPPMDLLMKFLKRDIVCGFTANDITYILDKENKIDYYNKISEIEKIKMLNSFNR